MKPALRTEGRRRHILARLEAAPECQVRELAAGFGVSEMTVRRDLDALAAAGRLIRTHGGAAPAAGVVFHFQFLERMREQAAAKAAIAAAAAARVPDGATVMLDSGTTTLAVARALRGKPGLTVVTTSLPVASELQHCEAIGVILLGGSMRRDAPDLGGALALRALEGLHADLAFLGADAVDARGVCYHASADVAHLVGAMAAAADRVYVVADHTKIGRTALARTGTLTRWAGLICDRGLDAAAARRLRRQGVTVMLPNTTHKEIA